jgi:hypothetical protein
VSKYILGVVAALVLASVGVAQDMPLFTFAKLGAKWEKAGDWGEALPIVGIEGAVTTLSRDGATVFAGYPDRAAVWAYPLTKDLAPDMAAGAPYAPLRIVEGYDNSREAREKRKAHPPTLAVLALTVDPAGRIYAATKKDIQVFDPTGRLCGVLPLPKPGTVTAIAWHREGGTDGVSKLSIGLDGTTWQREMK